MSRSLSQPVHSPSHGVTPAGPSPPPGVAPGALFQKARSSRLSGNHPARLWTWGWGAEFRDPQREGETRERKAGLALSGSVPRSHLESLPPSGTAPRGPPPTSLHPQCPDAISQEEGKFVTKDPGGNCSPGSSGTIYSCGATITL